MDPEQPLPEAGLQRVGVVEIIERGGRPEAEMGRAGTAGLGGDQHHPERRPRAVDRARRGPFQDFHRLDVVRVQVRGPVRRHGAFGLTELGERAAPIVRGVEVRGRKRRVVDRHAVHHEERLVRAEQGVDAANVDERAGPGIARLLQHRDVRRLGGKGLDHVDLARLLDQVGRNVVAHVPELTGLARGACARHHDFAQLQWVRREHEVVRHAARGQGDLSALRFVAQAPRHHRDGLARDPRARHDEGVATVVLAESTESHRRDGDFDLPQRLAGVARDFAGDRHRPLRGEPRTTERGEQGR